MERARHSITHFANFFESHPSRINSRPLNSRPAHGSLHLLRSINEEMFKMQDVPFNDQRIASDSDFLDHLKLPGAAGRQLTAARKENDSGAVERIVATHFRTRSEP